jgi:DeoR family transcriptional regulator of aga operon
MENITSPTSTLERRAKILDILEAEGHVSVQRLSKMFEISEVSIRKDLSHFEMKKLLIRTRGGGIKPVLVSFDLKVTEKSKKNFREKQKIGKKAVEFIKDGDSIILDSGSTIIELVKNLPDFERLTVITTSLPIADILCENENIRVVLPGGYLHKNMKSVVGNITEQTIQNFYCDILFLGADGIDVDYGLSTPTSEEASLARAMIKTAREVVVLADSSKFGRRSFAYMAPVSDIDTIITDENISDEDRAKLEGANVQVIIAG